MFVRHILCLLCWLPLSLCAQVDLELSISQSLPDPAQFTNYSVIVTLENTGPQEATDIRVGIPLLDGLVYQGGNEGSASAGNWAFSTDSWNIGSLSAGQSTSLTINYFLLAAQSPNTYAQVLAQNEVDLDSSPGNGTPPTPNEDDEASIDEGAGGGGVSDECAFIQTYPNRLLMGSQRSVEVNEMIDGYSIEQRAVNFNATEPIQTSVQQVDFLGEELSFTTDMMAAPGFPNTNASSNGAALTITYTDANGNQVFSTTVNVDPGQGPILDQITGAVQPANNGFLLLGTTVVQATSGVDFVPFVIRFDTQGNEIGQDQVPDNDVVTGGRVISRQSGSGDYLVNFRSGNVDLLLVDENGLVVWKADLFQDTPVSTLYEIEEASDGSAVYASIRDNSTGELLKFDAASGDLIYTVDYGSVIAGAADYVFENVEEFIPLADGGVVFGGTANRIAAPGGISNTYIYGRVDGAGIPVCGGGELTAIDNPRLTAEIQTSDGGFLLVGTSEENGTEVLTLVKITSEGLLTPNCNDLDPCDNDTEPPMLSNCPVDITVNAAPGATTTQINYPFPQISDNCSEFGSLFIDIDGVQPAFDVIPLGVNSTLITVIDEAGNTAQCSFDITVVGDTSSMGTDIEIALEQSVPNPAQFSFYTVTLTVSNFGTQSSGIVETQIPLPDGVVYQGGNEFFANGGAFDINTGIWRLRDLTPGISIELELNYFLLGPTAPNVYAQVIAQGNSDVDSTPNNGTPPTPNEDDEASTFDGTGGGSDECAFFQTYPDQILFGAIPTITVEELSTGYRLVQENIDAPNQQEVTRTIETDFNGKQLSVETDMMPAQMDPTTLVIDNGAMVNITYADGMGNPIFSTDVTIDPGQGTILDQVPGEVMVSNGGFLYVGTTVVESTNGVEFYLTAVRFDANGAVIGTDFFLDESTIGETRLTPRKGGSGDYIFTIRAGNADLLLIDGMGQFVWKVDLFTDTPSSTLFEVEESPDGSAVFVSLIDNSAGELRKFDSANGSLLYTVDYGTVFFNNTTNSGNTELVRAFIPLADGGAVFGGVVNKVIPNGPFDRVFAIGRVDGAGNTVWGRELAEAEALNVEAKIEATDGGFLFAGVSDVNGTSELTLVKYTSEGLLAPECDTGENPGVDLELSFIPDHPSPVLFEFVSATLQVTNTGDQPATIIEIEDIEPAGWVREGGNEYGVPSKGMVNGNTWLVPSLDPGETAFLPVHYFTLSTDPTFAYAQVTTQNEVDADSTPGNGDGQSANEDDEARANFNGASSALSSFNSKIDLSSDQLTALYPNPAMSRHTFVRLELAEAKEGVLLLSDSRGVVMQSYPFDLLAGRHELRLDLQELPAGLYQVQLKDQIGRVQVLRLMVLRP